MRRALGLEPRRAIVRVGLSLAVGALTYARVAGTLARSTALLVGWDAAGLALLALSWHLLASADAALTRERAGSEDPGRTLVYVTVVVTSIASLFAAALLVPGARSHTTAPAQTIALSLLTVAMAWAMTHTAFTFRYAHLYYREDAEGVGGVCFPGGDSPTYFDFAYFAFTVGMCFQVSDVSVTSPQIRRTLLLHAVISFVYNTVVLALVLNLVFGAAQ
ncbi:MAG TPA: DUF1345 domain-containing protein [Polyangiaceae bacterium]|nr:DUF1345 domain-containing protein [Polyangiaceae bacterium]